MSETGPNQEERIMAALSHGSVVLFGAGVIAAIVLWVTQKEKSAYVAFQALQATVYQMIGLVVGLIIMPLFNPPMAPISLTPARAFEIRLVPLSNMI